MRNLIVRVSGLVKDFNDVRALDGLTLDIGSGIFGLIGPNGAGKTTLLRVLLGLIQPDAGTAEVLGLRVDKESLRIRERLGILHERPTYPGRLTPSQFLCRVRDIYGIETDPRTLLDLVGLSSAANRKIGNLSAGMVQRLGIAQALIGQPELVFLDEPTSNLDVGGRAEITTLIMDLHNDLEISFIVASHVLSELERICDHVAFIREGAVLEQGKTLDLIEHYCKDCYRIDTDQPRLLAPVLEMMLGVRGVRGTSINALTFYSTLDNLSDFEREVRDTVSHLGIKIYAISQVSTLDNAYLEAMTHEL